MGNGFTELDILDYVHALWERRLTIAIGCAVGTLVGVALSIASPRRYEATVLLSVSSTRLDPADRNLVPASFMAVLRSKNVGDSLVREFKLDTPPDRLTASTLSERQVVEALPETNLLRVGVRLSRPDVAARVANRLVDISSTIYRRAGESEVHDLEGSLKAMVDEAAARVTTAEAAHDAHRRAAQYELLKRDVESLLEQRGKTHSLTVDIQAERARLSRAERELAARDRVQSLQQTIDRQPALMEAAREGAGSGSGLLGLELRSEYSNPVYAAIDQDVATTRARLEGLEKQRAALVALDRAAKKAGTLNRLYEAETTLARLSAEVELARKSYQETATRYQSAKLAVVGRMPQFLVLDPARPPEQPVGRMIRRNALLGLVFGLAAASMYALAAFGLGYADRARTARELD